VTSDRDGYTASEVCEAVGLRRTTLDVWLLRRYLKLSDGLGTGHQRRFTATEVILIATTAELTKLGLTVGAAAHAANIITRLADDGHSPQLLDGGWRLVIAPSLAPAGIEAPSLSPVSLIRPKTLTAMQRYIREKMGNPTSVVITDITAIAHRVFDRLKNTAPQKKGRPRKNPTAPAARQSRLPKST
jgi:hypothetical protein